MKSSLTNSKSFRLAAALLAALILLFAGAAYHSTAKLESEPADNLSNNSAWGQAAGYGGLSQRHASLARPQLVTQTTLFTPLITLIPAHDGTSVFISAGGIGELDGVVFANFDIGPAHKKGGYAMTHTGDGHYFATAAGFTQGQDEGGTVSITTTQGLNSGQIEFQRAFIETTQPEFVALDNNALTIDMPNFETFPIDAYLAVISTKALLGPLPPGQIPIGSAYSMRPSGALSQSNKFMTLKLGYQILPNNLDPHTLAVMGWNSNQNNWNNLGGSLFASQKHLTYYTKQFGIYMLAATPTWRDAFVESELSGVSTLINTEWWSPDEAIILSSGATSGTVTSHLIRPTAQATGWGTLHFTAITPPGTDLRLDLLDEDNQQVSDNVSDGADLSHLSLAAVSALKLRATLTSSLPGQTPQLQEWSLSWTVTAQLPKLKVYLPLIIKQS